MESAQAPPFIFLHSPQTLKAHSTEKGNFMSTLFKQTLSITFTYTVMVDETRLERGGDPDALAQRKRLLQAVVASGDQPLTHMVIRKVVWDLTEIAEREELFSWLTGYEPDQEEPLLPVLAALSPEERTVLEENMPDALQESIEDAFQAVLKAVTVV